MKIAIFLCSVLLLASTLTVVANTKNPDGLVERVDQLEETVADLLIKNSELSEKLNWTQNSAKILEQKLNAQITLVAAVERKLKTKSSKLNVSYKQVPYNNVCPKGHWHTGDRTLAKKHICMAMASVP